MSAHIKSSEDWQAVIAAHPLESHDPQEWLDYGVALLQTLSPGPGAAKQQQQAALAFVQAQKEGASQAAVQAAQHCSALISLQEALNQAGLPFPQGMADADGAAPNAQPQPPQLLQEQPTALADQQPLILLVEELIQAFDLNVSRSASILDQLLAVKEELRSRGVAVSAVEAVLRENRPLVEPEWVEAFEKVLMVLG